MILSFRTRLGKSTILVLLGLVGLVGSASGHRLATALSTIEDNPRTGQLEVIHELYAHDLEHVLNRSEGRLLDFEGNRDDLELAVALVEQDFELRTGGGTALPLTRVGAELDRGRLILYYETARPAELELLEVFDRILLDRVPGQVNRVNIRIDGPTRTLIFQGDEDRRELALGEPE